MLFSKGDPMSEIFGKNKKEKIETEPEKSAVLSYPRTKAVIARKVQQCHPQKSVHVVNKSLMISETKRGMSLNSGLIWVGR